MLPSRLRISKQATDVLKILKSRTGVTPNLICRIALAISLEEGGVAGDRPTDLEGSEFNLATLLGDNTQAYDCMIRQVHGHIEGRALNLVIASHIDNGLNRLKKSRSLRDLVRHSGVGTIQAGTPSGT
jgi:DNA sulfur modification protein DndE